MKKGKRFLTLILALALMFGLLPQSFAAAEMPQDSGSDSVRGVVMQFGPTVAASSPTEYTFDISEGNITIGDAGAGMVSITYGAEQTTSESFANTQQIILTGNTNSNVITVEEGVTANITLENVDIDVSEHHNYACAFSLNAGSSVSLTLTGINTLKSGTFMAGLAVPVTASLLITEGSTGELMASGGRGAGIGGGDNGVNGEITISGGFVNAMGRNYSAGIGGGNFSTNQFAVCGLITITGGVVTATGGEFAAGIGGGQNNSGNVMITGGTVAAIGGRFGAGIGGGYGGNGTVIINDGNVTAQGGNDAAGIGGGTGGVGRVTISGGRIEADSDSWRGIGGGTVLQGCEIVITGGSVKSSSMGVTPTNGDSPVYLATVGLYGITAQTMTYSVDGEDEITLDTPDGRLYLWLTEGVHTISVINEADEEYWSKFVVLANNDNKVSPATDATSVTDGSIVITSAGGYVITGSTTVNFIAVSNGIEGDVYITLEDVSIDVSTVYSACAFSLGEGSSVILTLKGTNTLKSGGGAAGLAVPSTASLWITEDSIGELTAVGGMAGAGIGSGDLVDGGNITIQGGIITAVGGMAGAGIGGGHYSNGGNVMIQGGIVTATGGDGGAGIGGGQYGNGGNVTIQGGIVTAAGGYGGAGIGGGLDGSGGNVIIRGGTVKALAGDGSEDIGKGYNGTDTGILKNLSSAEGGTDVFLTTVILAGVTTESAVSSLTINFDEVSYSYGTTGIFTDTTGRLYLYLPEGAEVAAAQTSDGTYIGLIATTADHLAVGTLSPDTATQLAAPENLAWDVVTPGKATWMADTNAISYDVQLYKSGTALGGSVIVSSGEEHDFTSIIETEGTGVYTFTVKAIGDGVNYTDSAESPVSAEYSYTAPSTGTAPTITTATLPNGTVGTAYSQTLAADGDTPISWTIDSGSLPDGLTLSSAGVISGTPTTAGTFDFTVEATNAEGSGTKALEIIISSATVTGAEISPDTGSFDRYSPGDVTTSITWNSATAVTGISDGAVSLASPAHYEVSGNTLTVKEAYLETQAEGSVVLTIAFDQGDPATLTVSITDSTPPSISPASASYDLTAPDDVTTTITWNRASTVTGVVYDANSLVSGTDYTVTGSALTIKDSYLSGLGLSENDTLVFDISFNTTGDTAVLTVHVVDSYMPSGDADLSDLTVGGSTVGGFDPADDEYNVELPYGTQPGNAAARVDATANDPLAQVSVTQASSLPGSATVTVTAEDETIKTYTVNFTLGAAPGTVPTIITASLPGGTVGTAYSQTLAAAGDTPITWSIDSGNLPDGLSLSGNTISGIPTVAGTFGFTVKAENAEGSDTMALEIVIGSTPPTGTAPTITTTSLPDGRVGSSYSRSLAATGDTPITWMIDGGSLPNGLTFNGSTTGVISGTPTARGNFSFTVKATNAVGSVTKNLSITINAASTGDGSGGGSSDGGTTVIIQPEKEPDQPVIAGFSATPTVNSGGHATVTVSQKSVADAIARAQADAKAQGKSANGIAISLNIGLPDTAKSLGIVLPQATLKSLVDAGVKQLEINGAIISLDFDLEALKEIQNQSTGDVTITIKPTQNLSEAAKKLIGTRPVYDVTVSYVRDGKTVNITSLGKGGAILSIPYTPGKNEAVGYLFGVFVNANGQVAHIPGSAYDANNRSIILSTDHLSVYGIGYTVPTEKYTDIATQWARESIDYAVGRGLFSGTTEKTFSPNTAMNRGMLVTVLGRLAGADVSGYKTSSFSDVSAGKYYLPYVEWAYKKGIISGIGNGQFASERAVTREEFALILQNYAKATGYTLPVTREAITFADNSSIGSGYASAVRAMQQAGIMMGGSSSKFNPKAGATRAEASAMLHRYVKLTIDLATAQGWAKNDDGRYMYYKDGKPLTGWQTIEGTRYFFHTNGTLQTGWVKDGDNWRFYSGNRALVGWWDIGSETSKKRYYFYADAIMVSGKWLQIDSKWYYFNADGSLTRSTTVDGYEVDENGVRKTK